MLEFNHIFFFLPLSRVKWMKMSRKCLNKFYRCVKANHRKSKQKRQGKLSIFINPVMGVYLDLP